MTSLNAMGRSRWVTGSAPLEPVGSTGPADRPDPTQSSFAGESRVHVRGMR
jgi:hypothetical protein